MALSNEYDFIIVGAGPAGCSLARGLANSLSRPSVCLVEAGSINNDASNRVIGNLFVQKMNPDQAKLYESKPQQALSGRKIDLTRGAGLGGSSAVNFTAWTVPPRDDFEAIADVTGDPSWRWENAKRRYKALETYHDKHPEVPAGTERYLSPKSADHGYSGPLHVGFDNRWDSYATEMMDIWSDNGYSINPDLGNGDFLGISICPKTVHRGTRVTADNLLYPLPSNLHIKTESHVRRVIFEGKRATGISLLDGTVLSARKEVILCAGALDTPKILMHSGIGPAEQLSKFGIQVIVDSQFVGLNTKDHYHVALKYGRSEESNEVAAFFRDKARQEAALREWNLYRTGDFSNLGTAMNMGFFKNDAVLKSQEFKSLPKEEQTRLEMPTVPTYEIAVLGIAPEYYLAPETSPPLLSVLVFVHNSQYNGSMRLVSDDPTVPLDFDVGFMVHPYDRRVAIEATKEVLKVTGSAAFRKDEHPTQAAFDVPKDDSDESILAFWNKDCTSTWHTVGSCKMGRRGDETAVVDTQFSVKGFKGLRVADLSVLPVLVSAHTQTAAYQIGMLAAEKLVAEYSLNGKPAL
ncbi:unnamed protein product [Clonostachys solani]|uniref:Glucose-methanol-choline oxidoreductase N-terminal domain-containing protein n=1 Tax=Clonostachys solani TaxID=160281 RepID=A0A9N9ZAI3_9HYPO|nr:unnamed protein product [Clonostachys solani]